MLDRYVNLVGVVDRQLARILILFSPLFWGYAVVRFVDPMSMSPQKGLETIGNGLLKQYERWQPRARYKQLLDPTIEEVRKVCLALRKNAKVRLYIMT